MKSKSFRYGKYSFKSYLKSVGNGFEVGFYFFDSKPIFIGNFISQKEATQWYSLQNTAVRSFLKKYHLETNLNTTWYKHFMRNDLYKNYYSWLDGVFSKHNRDFTLAWSKDVKKFRNLKAA